MPTRRRSSLSRTKLARRFSRKDSRTLDLFAGRSDTTRELLDLTWPDPDRFPLNLPPLTDVAAIVRKDLGEARDRLIVTGYAGLEQIVDFVGSCPTDQPIRILFGCEPFPSRRGSFELDGYNFPKEVEAYWLERGISLRLSAAVVQCIEKLRDGRLAARYLGRTRCRLHAKIYSTELAATVGSSNFTRPGLHGQLEANARFTAANEPSWHRDLRSIAENFWQKGIPYADVLAELLERLLKIVEWREALARACAELLEGEWAKAYLKRDYLPQEGQLWPSQRQGIAQALYILTRRGSALIADCTGSGKTRMGVHLMGAVADHNIRIGRMRHGKTVMICPPVVAPNWELESTLAGIHLDVHSHGVLSHEKSRRHELTVEALRRAQILSIDEGHNFLNVTAIRTQRMLRNMADYVLMFTATPLNRSVLDLLRIADILGADNLDPATISMFRKLMLTRNLNRTLEEDEILALRREIKRFTVRRTKRLLGHLIARDPKQYRDRNGRACRYPEHTAEIYPLKEPREDCALAREIRELADQLYAVARFRKQIEMPDVLQGRISEEEYLRGRLSSARKIARFLVMKSLRSSRVALAEHLVGTKQAAQDFFLEDFRKTAPTGNFITVLEKIAGKVPQSCLSVALPDWLADPQEHARACRWDQDIYREIYGRLRKISDTREREKAGLLLRLVKEEKLVLAFDSRPITLAVIQRHIQTLSSSVQVITATGDPYSERERALKAFALGSAAENVIGLCSDSLSEGVNFQQAAALVHLDMPSVVRIAEQRAGRIDRLDSPHARVRAFWPGDAKEFTLSSDERFIERHETVEALLGTNLILPEGMRQESKPLSTAEIIREFEEEARKDDWDGLQDAFEPVRALVNGPTALVSEKIYEHYRAVAARIVTRVSLVNSRTSWAFFCLAGGEFGAPRWVFMPNLADEPLCELESVSEALRERLTLETENVKMDDTATRLLDQFVIRLARAERVLLPRKKQRALDEMEIILSRMIGCARERQDQVVLDKLTVLREVLTNPEPPAQPDLDEIASRWIDLIRPTWYACLKRPRQRPLLLSDIRPFLLEEEPELRQQVLNAFERIPVLETPEDRIAACILGVP
jgi:hypothetical protein